MINKRTVLVVGAGASAECKLPTGHELKERIAELLKFDFSSNRRQSSGDRTIVHALEIAIQESNEDSITIRSYLQAARKIRDAMPLALSIDNFLDAHQGNLCLELCGKLAIVRSILAAEKRSPLYFDSSLGQQSPRFETTQETWLTSFFQLLTENCKVADLAARLSRITLIVFNYDRCIEHFLFHAFRNYYELENEQVIQLMGNITVYHPYGTVGALPWQSQNNAIAFGAEPSPSALLNLAGQIRTFTEGTDPSTSSIISLREELLRAQIVLFLGFAYHQLNLDLLRPEKPVGHINPQSTLYFGTTMGISPSDCKVISAELNSLSGKSVGNITLDPITCSQLFSEYWRSLSLAR